MKCRSKILLLSLILVSMTAFGDKSFADQIEAVQHTAETVDSGFAELGAPVGNEVLDTLSGENSIAIDTIDVLANNMKLNGNMKDNLLQSTNTGLNQISNDAFSNASGISTVVQNSGNQVIINNALILNLQVQ